MSDSLPPPVGPRGLALRAGLQGAAAFDRGLSVLACPYGPTRPYARRSWLEGYALAQLAGGGRTPADAADEVDEAAPWPGDTPPATA